MFAANLFHPDTGFTFFENSGDMGFAKSLFFPSEPAGCIVPENSTYGMSTFRGSLRLILNWLKKMVTFTGVRCGFKSKEKLTMIKAYGFKTLKCLEITP